LPAGLVTDRAERRRTMAGAVTLAAAALATLAALLGAVPVDLAVLAAVVLAGSSVAFRGSDTKRGSSLRADVVEGLKLVAAHRQLRAFTAMTAIANVASEGAVVVLVLYAVAPGPLGLSRVGYGPR
ncbi:MAG: hypothetical protein ACYDH5_10430, partial [Acidimicrobiales bacterium]